MALLNPSTKANMSILQFFVQLLGLFEQYETGTLTLAKLFSAVFALFEAYINPPTPVPAAKKAADIATLKAALAKLATP